MGAEKVCHPELVEGSRENETANFFAPDKFFISARLYKGIRLKP